METPHGISQDLVLVPWKGVNFVSKVSKIRKETSYDVKKWETMHVKNDRHAGEDMSLIISSVLFFFLSSFCLLHDFLLSNFAVTLYLRCFLSHTFLCSPHRDTMSGEEWYTPLYSVMLLFVSLRVQVKPPSVMIRSWDHLFCRPVVAFIFRLRDLFPFFISRSTTKKETLRTYRRSHPSSCSSVPSSFLSWSVWQKEILWIILRLHR